MKAMVKMIVALCMAALLVACGKADSVISLSADSIVLAYGDSLTAGNGSTAGNNYPAVLDDLLLGTVINAGISGETSAQGLARLPAALDDSNPDVLTLIHGGNDFLQRIDTDETRDNIRTMVQIAADRNIQVVLAGVPRPGIILSVDSLYSEIADEFKLPIDNKILKKILSDRQFKSDQVHPNNEGYRLLAEAVAAMILN